MLVAVPTGDFRGGSGVGDRRPVRDTVACCDLELLLGRQDTSKRDAFLQVPEMHEGTGPIACRLHAWVARAMGMARATSHDWPLSMRRLLETVTLCFQ
jgi:hypothetical protein